MVLQIHSMNRVWYGNEVGDSLVEISRMVLQYWNTNANLYSWPKSINPVMSKCHSRNWLKYVIGRIMSLLSCYRIYIKHHIFLRSRNGIEMEYEWPTLVIKNCNEFRRWITKRQRNYSKIDSLMRKKKIWHLCAFFPCEKSWAAEDYSDIIQKS